MIYNEEYIREFDLMNYINILKDNKYLSTLTINYSNRYNPRYSMFDGKLNLLKESLDHYVLKRMSEDSNFINTEECNNYFNYLKKLSNQNDYEYHSNVVLSNVLNRKEFIEYKEKYIGNNIDKFNEKIRNNNNKLNDIVNKIKNNQEISQDELDLMCGVVSDYRKDCKILRDTIKYVFNNLTKQNSKLKCSPQVLSAILTCVPYLSDKIKKNGFEPSNIRMYASNRLGGKDFNGVGMSLGNSKAVIMSGKKFSNISFKSIESIENTYLKDVDKYNDFSMLMIVAFHEITHQYQRYMAGIDVEDNKYNKDFFTDGYPMAIRGILDSIMHDYNENHDNDDIEIHATKVGWEMCNDFYSKMIDDKKLKETLTSKCKRNMNATSSRYAFATKKDKIGNVIDKEKYDNDNLIKIMSDSKIRDKWFKKSPHLKQIFTKSGKFNLGVLFIYNFGYTQLGGSLLENLINTQGIDNIILNYMNSNEYGEDKIRYASDNIYLGIRYATKKLSSIEYYTRFGFTDQFKVNKDLLVMAKDIIDNQVNTIINGKRILNNVLNCYDYDMLIDNMINVSKNYYDNTKKNLGVDNKNLSSRGR